MNYRYLEEWQGYVKACVQKGQDRWLNLESYAFHRDNRSNPYLGTCPSLEKLSTEELNWRNNVTALAKQGRHFLPLGWTDATVEQAKGEWTKSLQDMSDDQLWSEAFAAPPPITEPQSPQPQEPPSNWRELDGEELWRVAFGGE